MSDLPQNLESDEVSTDKKPLSFFNICLVVLVICLIVFIAQAYKTYLSPFTGYGDADMINFYDEDGSFIEPLAANNKLATRCLR